jgi:hypothetical protein
MSDFKSRGRGRGRRGERGDGGGRSNFTSGVLVRRLDSIIKENEPHSDRSRGGRAGRGAGRGRGRGRGSGDDSSYEERSDRDERRTTPLAQSAKPPYHYDGRQGARGDGSGAAKISHVKYDVSAVAAHHQKIQLSDEIKKTIEWDGFKARGFDPILEIMPLWILNAAGNWVLLHLEKDLIRKGCFTRFWNFTSNVATALVTAQLNSAGNITQATHVRDYIVTAINTAVATVDAMMPPTVAANFTTIFSWEFKTATYRGNFELYYQRIMLSLMISLDNTCKNGGDVPVHIIGALAAVCVVIEQSSKQPYTQHAFNTFFTGIADF